MKIPRLFSNAETKFKRTFHFFNLLKSIKDEYDYIWIDVGPSTDIKVDNAMVAADYFIITQETKTYS
ncbi:AAA family ATPase, partial [Jeotgalibaca porci]